MANNTTHPNVEINKAIIFATNAHGNQVRKGTPNPPHVFHSFDVARKIAYHSGLPDDEMHKAIVLAILHDTVEDTDVTHQEIYTTFGEEMRNAVRALSKDEALSRAEGIVKEVSLRENLQRIRREPQWVQAVKLADRISNLKVFPAFWSREKITQYLKESKMIADTLHDVSEGLRARLLGRIQRARIILAIKS